MKKTVLLITVSLLFFFGTQAMAGPYKMRLSHQMPESHFLAKEIQDFKNQVEKSTGGRVIIEIYPAAQAFKPKELIPAVVSGAIESGLAINFQWAGMIPAMDTFIIPFLLTDIAQVQKAMEGEVGHRFDSMLQAKGVVPIMWLLQTTRNVYTSNQQVLKLPADFKGKKMRGTSKVMNLGSEALGASTMPVSGPEVYTALQRGTLDIGLTGPGAALQRHYYEIQKYGTVAATFSVIHVVFVNAAFWNSLPPDLQKSIKTVAAGIQKKGFEVSRLETQKAIDELATKMTIHIQTPEEEAAWRAVMVQPVLDYYKSKTGKEGEELITLIEQIKR
jgi:TRAP-type C4-dicarboxylate transport system substrate-binding protein